MTQDILQGLLGAGASIVMVLINFRDLTAIAKETMNFLSIETRSLKLRKTTWHTEREISKVGNTQKKAINTRVRLERNNSLIHSLTRIYFHQLLNKITRDLQYFLCKLL